MCKDAYREWSWFRIGVNMERGGGRCMNGELPAAVDSGR